jgi:hypothetical protein
MKLKIDEPCHEDWNKMSLKEKGRHCKACDKLVLDMTKYSDSEIIQFFENKKYNVCGQFEESQIERELVANAESKRNKVKRSLIAASLAGTVFSANTLNATGEQVDRVESIEKDNSESNKETEDGFDETVLFLIKGKVVDPHGKAILGATISLGEDHAKTNERGEFELSLGIYESEPLDLKLYIYAPGMESKAIDLNLDFDKTTVDIGKVKMSKQIHHVKGKVRIDR